MVDWATTCLAADMFLTSDPRVVSLIRARSHTDHEIMFLPSTDLRRVVVSYKQNYVPEVLVNHFVKLSQEKNVIM